MLKGAIGSIAAERARQQSVEKFWPDADDQWRLGDLACAAAAYAVASVAHRVDTGIGNGEMMITAGMLWPFELAGFKPTTARRDLVKAGALIVAEIERLDRMAASASEAVKDRETEGAW